MHRIERLTSKLTGWFGSVPAIAIAFGVVLSWAISGPVFGFSETWQLVINTGTTIVTFGMVFIIQNTQNRDGRAIQTKLDAIIEALENAPDDLVDLEDLPEATIKEVQQSVHGAGSGSRTHTS